MASTSGSGADSPPQAMTVHPHSPAAATAAATAAAVVAAAPSSNHASFTASMESTESSNPSTPQSCGRPKCRTGLFGAFKTLRGYVRKSFQSLVHKDASGKAVAAGTAGGSAAGTAGTASLDSQATSSMERNNGAGSAFARANAAGTAAAGSDTAPSGGCPFDSVASRNSGGGGGGGGVRNSLESRSARGSGGERMQRSSGELLQLSPMASAFLTESMHLPEAWNIVDFAELELAKVLGEGSFGRVWLAKWCKTPVAVKMLSQSKVHDKTAAEQQETIMRQLTKEVSIMAKLRHPNCAQYLGVVLDPPCVLMEYCSRRSVDCLLAAGRTDAKIRKQLSWARLLGMATDAAKGILYLHSRHPAIVHRDLKSANLLVDAHWKVKVSDFNLSKASDPNSTTSTVIISNPRWLAPEILLGGSAHIASDIWAFGTVLWELLTWQLPFEKMNPFQIIVTVTTAAEGSGLALPASQSELPAGPFHSYPQYIALMKECWARDPAKRPSMDTIVSRLLPMLSAELRMHSTVSAGSGGVSTPTITPHPSRSLEESGPSATAPAQRQGQQQSPGGGRVGILDRRSSGGPGDGRKVQSAGEADSKKLELQRAATQALEAEGYVTVANAGLSQVDSGRKGYPFVNPDSFFSRIRSELDE